MHKRSKLTADLVPPKGARRQVTLDDLVAREHARVVLLTREVEQAKRKLLRARIRYSTLTRLAADQARRNLTGRA